MPRADATGASASAMPAAATSATANLHLRHDAPDRRAGADELIENPLVPRPSDPAAFGVILSEGRPGSPWLRPAPAGRSGGGREELPRPRGHELGSLLGQEVARAHYALHLEAGGGFLRPPAGGAADREGPISPHQ